MVLISFCKVFRVWRANLAVCLRAEVATVRWVRSALVTSFMAFFNCLDRLFFMAPC